MSFDSLPDMLPAARSPLAAAAVIAAAVVVLAVASVVRRRRRYVEEQVVSLLRRVGPSSAREIEHDLGIHHAHVEAALDRLFNRGVITWRDEPRGVGRGTRRVYLLEGVEQRTPTAGGGGQGWSGPMAMQQSR